MPPSAQSSTQNAPQVAARHSKKTVALPSAQLSPQLSPQHSAQLSAHLSAKNFLQISPQLSAQHPAPLLAHTAALTAASQASARPSVQNPAQISSQFSAQTSVLLDDADFFLKKRRVTFDGKVSGGGPGASEGGSSDEVWKLSDTGAVENQARMLRLGEGIARSLLKAAEAHGFRLWSNWSPARLQ